MNAAVLAPGEPLSPELVLVLPAELRAEVVACLPAPIWAQLRPRTLPASPAAPSFARVVAVRAGMLAGIFVAITILTLAMSFVAQALR